MNIKKKKSKCPCCGAKGYEFEKPYMDYGRLHWQDSSSDPETTKGWEDMKGSWIAACIHKTKEKEERIQTWSEYECDCSCANL